MPRNRADQDRDGKRQAIVSAARRLFGAQGFERTSVAAVAAEAEITKNTVYWYFDDKDALLLAAVSDALAEARSAWEAGGPEALPQRLLALVETFDAIHPLTTALHARAGVSASVAAWHERFHAAGDRWLHDEIVDHLERTGAADPATVDIATTVRLWSIAIEGMVSHQLEPELRRSMCELLVGQLHGAARAH